MISSLKRLPAFPDLPTVAETLPGFESTGWFALVAPRGTPEVVIQQAHRDLNAVLETPSVKDKLASLGNIVRPMSIAETSAYIKKEQEVWRPVVKQVGFGGQN